MTEQVKEIVEELTSQSKRIEKKHGKKGVAYFWIIIGILLVFTVLFWKWMINVGTNAAVNSFKEEVAQTRSEYYATNKEKGFEKGKKDNAVSLVSNIHLQSIKEISKLEVLSIIKEEYVIQEGNKDNNNVHSWVKYRGVGTFTIDLRSAEFIVDNQSNYVLARIEKPVLTDFEIDLDNSEQILYADNTITVPIIGVKLNDGSIEAGVKLAMAQKQKATEMIRKNLLDPSTIVEANNNAKTAVEELIRKLNYNNPDIKIDIQFYDE